MVTSLSEFVVKKSVRAESIQGFEELQVLGVSNKYGITVTDHKKSKDLAKYLFIEEGDFAYNPYRVNVGSIGLVSAGVTGLVSPAYVVFSTKDSLLPELLLDFLKSQEGLHQIAKYARGTVRKALRFEDLIQIELPVPPIEKQNEILKKRKAIENEVDGLKSEFKCEQILLKELRLQILWEAIEGKLTADWRTRHRNVESASELLKRIAFEKAKLVKDKKITAQKHLPPISDEEKPFELPEGWVWCRLEEVGLFERGKSKHRPRNDPRLFENGRFPFVQTGDVARSKKNGHKISTFSQRYNKFGLAQSRVWKKGTLCITIAANIAETGFLSFDACFPDSVVGFSSISGLTNAFYVKYFIDATRDEIEKFAPATAQKNINLGIINMLLFPLPPREEQQSIVTKVENLLTLCDELGARISQNQNHAEQLIQAVLKDAFSHNKKRNGARS